MYMCVQFNLIFVQSTVYAVCACSKPELSCVYVCMRICMHVCMHMYMYMYVHVCIISVYIYTCTKYMYVCMHMYMYVCVCIICCTCACVCAYICKSSEPLWLRVGSTAYPKQSSGCFKT